MSRSLTAVARNFPVLLAHEITPPPNVLRIASQILRSLFDLTLHSVVTLLFYGWMDATCRFPAFPSGCARDLADKNHEKPNAGFVEEVPGHSIQLPYINAGELSCPISPRDTCLPAYAYHKPSLSSDLS